GPADPRRRRALRLLRPAAPLAIDQPPDRTDAARSRRPNAAIVVFIQDLDCHRGHRIRGMARRTASAIGWILTALVGLFLLFGGGARLAGFAPYIEGMTKFGYEASLAPWIGLTLLVSTILMLIPQTAVIGSVLVTGYLGGATATHLRIHDAWFLFPVALG